MPRRCGARYVCFWSNPPFPPLITGIFPSRSDVTACPSQLLLTFPTLPSPLFFYCYYYDPVALPASGLSVSFPIRRLICIMSVCHSLSPCLFSPSRRIPCRIHHESSIVSLYTCTTTFPFLSSLFLLFCDTWTGTMISTPLL
jgi:hypothetical protein